MLKTSLISGLAAAALLVSTPAQATLTLTTAGQSDGFTLTTFVNGYDASYGPLAQGIAPNGNVITGSLLNEKIYVFKDVDGQTLASALTSVPYTAQTGNANFAMTTAGGQVYGAQLQGAGVYEHFANDGTFSPIPNLQTSNLFGNLGMWGDPVNGHIVAASNKGLVEIDPIAGTFRVINPNLFPDGVSVSANGEIAYVENGGTIQAYSMSNGTLLHTYFTGHSPDGTGVIYSGPFAGDIVVNDNDGTVGLLNPSKPDNDPTQFTLIADLGTRGDFVSLDTKTGTLFLSQQDEVARLACGSGGCFGPPPPTTTPEPATSALFGIGMLVGALLWGRKLAGLSRKTS